MMRHKSFTLLVVAMTLVGIFGGCSRMVENRDIRRTLRFAGDNREELKAVLSHYKGDVLKERAARYLIANMQDDGCLEGRYIDSIKVVMSDISAKGAVDSIRKDKWMHCDYHIGARTRYDAQTLTAEYLIENIDLAFEAWEKWPWGKYYSFEDFCEYILPYRIGDEVPDHWRRAYSEKFSSVLEEGYSGTDVVEAVIFLHKYLKDSTSFAYENDFSSPRLGGEYLLRNKVGACREGTDMVTYMLRSLGIPASADTYRYSPDAYLGHSWNVFMDTTGLFLPTEYGRATTRRDWQDLCSKGKVYREGRDVTEMYFQPNRVVLPQVKRGRKGGCIGVFSMDGWIPIGRYGRSLSGRAVVRNIEPDQVYQPLGSASLRANATGYPFYVNGDGTATVLRPDFDDLQTIRVTRKHPLTEYWTIASEYQDSVTFYGSADGSDWVFLAESNTGEGKVERERHMYPSVSEPLRYIKVCPLANKALSIAELHVFADDEGTEEVALSVVSAPEPLYGQTSFSAEKAIDGQNLSRFESGTKGAPIVFELGEPSRIARIDHAPHNDDNYVSPGDTYELFYQNGEDGWIPLGEQRAEHEWLDFEGVPSGALLWLHDKTKGREEQTFRWMDGRQVFCYEEYYRRKGHKHYVQVDF